MNENYYILHEKGTEPTIITLKYIIKYSGKRTPHIFKISGLELLVNTKLDVNDDGLNSERINLQYGNVKHIYEVVDFHDENTPHTFYRRTGSEIQFTNIEITYK